MRRPAFPSGGPLDVLQERHAIGSRVLPAFYTEWEVTPWAGTRLVPGVRADHSNGASGWDIAPRVTFRQDLTTHFPRTTLKGGAGLFYQPPNPAEADPVFFASSLQTPNSGEDGLKSNRSVHYDLGMEQEFTSQIEVT